MAALQLFFFGQMDIQHNGHPLPNLPTLKTQSLLAYLVMNGRSPQPRAQLAGIFWGDRPERKARRSLNTALWHVRQTLPTDDSILADGQTVQFNPHSDYWLDVAEFVAKTERLKSVSPEDEAAIGRLSEAVALYRNDFLEGFYDDWCLEERYRLESVYLEALEQLVTIYEMRRQPEAALGYVMPLLARAPLREDVHRSAIRLQMALGNRAEAMRLAQRSRTLLRAELGVELASESIDLYDRLLGPAWRGDVREKDGGGNGRSLFSHPAFMLEHPPLVGREKEWQTLLSHWDRAKSGHSQLILLSGEAGIGKSRLVGDLSQYIRRRGNLVAHGNCYEYEYALPYGPLTDLLHAVLSFTDSQLLDILPPWQLLELARLVPELNERLPPSRSLSFPMGEESDKFPNGQDQARLFEAFTRFLLKLAEQTPLFLLLEDMHWAHTSTLGWLHYLGRHLSASPVLLVVTYRHEEVGIAHPLPRLALQMEQDRLADRIELPRLSQNDLTYLMPGANESLVNLIYRQTEGNPFFTLEILRDLIEKGQIQLEGNEWAQEALLVNLPIPSSIAQVVQMRLERLSPLIYEAAAMAAVIGSTFDFDVFNLSWGQGEEIALEAIDELLRRRLIHEGYGIASRDYVFDHHLVREVIYHGLHHRRRQRFHRLVGEAFEQLYGEAVGAPGEVAHHYHIAGKAAKALHFYNLAAQKAKALFAWPEAIQYLSEMLAMLQQLDPDCMEVNHQVQRDQALVDRILLYSHLGQLVERDNELAALIDLAKTSGDQKLYLQSFIYRVLYLNLDGHYEKSIVTANEGIALAERLNDVSAQCHFLAHIGFAHYFLGRPYPALCALETAITLSKGKTDDDMQGQITHYLGYVHFHLGNYAKSLAYQREAYVLHQTVADPNSLAWSGLDVGAVLLEMGRYAEAREYLDEHLALARQIHSRSAEAFGLTQVGCWHLYRGDYGTAVALFQQALDAHKGLRRYHTQAEAEEGLGLAYLHLGDLHQAASWLRVAIKRARSIQHRRRLVKALIGLGLVKIAAGNFSEACLTLGEAVTVARESENWADLAAGLSALACAVRRTGDSGRAMGYAEEGIQISQEKGLTTTEMWAELETGLALLSLREREAGVQHLKRATALIDLAHQRYIKHEDVRQVSKHYLSL